LIHDYSPPNDQTTEENQSDILRRVIETFSGTVILPFFIDMVNFVFEKQACQLAIIT
jgi:hypothetical protein